MGFRRVLFAASLASLPAEAQPAPVHLTYAAYFTWIEVAELQGDITVAPQTYRMQLSFHLVGVAATLFHAQGSSTVDGRFQGDVARPRELFSSGRSGGKQRVVQIDYQGDKPVVSQMQPPLEPEREPVPPAEQLNTIDSLSAMAVLFHRVWTTGGEEALEQTSRSVFNGTALRCNIEGRQLAGFWRDADEAELHKPHRASVWFARTAPGGPLVPVRIAIETRGFGSATLYLTGEG